MTPQCCEMKNPQGMSFPKGMRYAFSATVSFYSVHCRQPLAACGSMSCSCEAPTEVMAARTARAILSIRSLSIDSGPSFRAPSAKCFEGPPEGAPESTTIYKTRAPKKHQKEHQNRPPSTKHEHQKSTRKSTRIGHNLQNTSTKKAPERAPESTTIYKTRAPEKHQNWPQSTKHEHQKSQKEHQN